MLLEDILLILIHAFQWMFFRCQGEKWYQLIGVSQGTQLAVGLVTLVGQFLEHMHFLAHPRLLEWILRMRWIDDSVL